MPNYVKNVLRVVSDDKRKVESVFESIRSEEMDIDFNKIIPCPEVLQNFYSADLFAERIALWMCRDLMYPVHKKDAINEYESLEPEVKEKYAEEAKTLLRNIIEYGSSSGYRWCIEHWDTKWNAFRIERKNDNELLFETAWNCPLKVLVALSKMYPDVKFECQYASEDVGYSCGEFSLSNGLIFDTKEPEGGSIEAYERSFSLWPEYKCCYKLTKNGYESVEEDAIEPDE